MRACIRLSQHLLYPCLAIVLSPNIVVASFDRSKCRKGILEMLQEDPSMAQDTNTFAADKEGNLLSSHTMALLIPACDRICGTGWAKNPDAAPRLMTWLVPVVVLTLNLQYAAIGKERFLTVLHLLGDPIHSTWSLLSKVETWRQCYDRRKGRSKNEAVMIAGIGELVETLDVDFNAAQVKLILQDIYTRLETQPANFDNLVANTASELAECRVNQTMRTWAAIVLYLIHVIAALVPKLGQASSPSGGRIGTAMLLSWLLPIVLLSNAVGDFTSRKTFLRIMLAFMEQIERQSTQCLSRPSQDLLMSLRKIDEKYFKSLAWSCEIYTYRSHRIHSRTAAKGCSTPSLALISALPVIVAFVTAFLVLYTKPTYFNCRHFFVLTVLGAWLLSPLLTWTIGTHFSQQRQWQLVLVKDALFAFPIMALIIASSCGLFNSCRCWSGVYTLGIRMAAVYLTDLPEFDRYNQVNYPGIIGTCLGLQVGFFLLIRWTYWREGFNLLAWSEKEREAAFLRRLQSSTVMRDLKAPASVEVNYFGWDSSYA